MGSIALLDDRNGELNRREKETEEVVIRGWLFQRELLYEDWDLGLQLL